jgi:hypothetical protein
MPWTTQEYSPDTWGGSYIYAENPDFMPPVVGTTRQYPQLGIISDYSYSGSDNYVVVYDDCGGKNLDLHFSGFNPDKTLHCDRYTRNIGFVGSYIHDHYMTVTSGTASYLYDQHARTSPPPGFPQFTIDQPALHNWHIIRE